MKNANSPLSLIQNNEGHYQIAGISLKDLTEQYGSPLYVIDQKTIEANCAAYTETLKNYYPNSCVYFAAKANINIGLLDLLNEQDLGADVVSLGELYTALQSRIPSERCLLHGNNKSDEELRLAIENNVLIVIDNFDELLQIKTLIKKNEVLRCLLRFNPDILTNTHRHIQTGHAGSKFGMDKEACIKCIQFINKNPALHCLGLHSHIGSQILDLQPYLDLIQQSCSFLKYLKDSEAFEATHLNLGGGMGIAYQKDDPKVPISRHIKSICESLIQSCKDFKLKQPMLLLEPGRSIVGTAGITLYTVGRCKESGPSSFIFVDGGMSDNPRPIMYDAAHDFDLEKSDSNKEKKHYDIAGKFCETGDILGRQILLESPQKGDILFTRATGAYNYAMASNYNRARKPAMVLVNEGQSQILVDRESLADIIAKDRPLEC